MSEFLNAKTQRRDFRGQLLATVSAIALLICGYDAGEAWADNASRPILWIELGGQLDRMEDGQAPVLPPDMTAVEQDGFSSPSAAQRPPAYGLGWDGKILLQPEDSDWIFSASVRYGRSNSSGLLHQEKNNPRVVVNMPQYPTLNHYKYPTQNINLIDVAASNNKSHVILDFQAGKDVGLGMFGSRGSSTVSLGVRIAQFHSNSTVTMHITPDVRYRTMPVSSLGQFFHYELSSPPLFHRNDVTATERRNFQGVGPSLSWSVSAPLAGDTRTGQIAFDWGANVAALFGRQKVDENQETKILSFGPGRDRFGVQYTRDFDSHALAFGHRAECGRLRRTVVPDREFRGQNGLSRGFLLRRDGWWHRHAQDL